MNPQLHKRRASGDGGDQCSGLDRFGRVVDQNWLIIGGATTDRFQYGYDRDGNVLYKNNLLDSTFSELYHANSSTSGDNNTAYDNLNRLTGFRRGTLSASMNNSGGLDTVTTLNSNANSSQTWTLDAVGNQTNVTTDGTAKTNTVNSQNELTGFGSSTLAFDNDGNTTTDDQGHTLIYDAWNKLVQVKNGGTTLATYAYDATGNRIKQNDGAAIDLYNSSQGQVVEERQSGTVTNQYVWSIAYVNSPVLRDDNTSGGSYGIGSSGLGQRVYAQNDANFNITSLENTSGAVQKRFVYTPYGVMSVFSGTTTWVSGSNSLGWVYSFQGGRADDIVGMVHFGARDYSPTTATWVQRDPTGYTDSSNMYEFVMDSPSNFTDISGQASTSDIKFAVTPKNEDGDVTYLHAQFAFRDSRYAEVQKHISELEGQGWHIYVSVMAHWSVEDTRLGTMDPPTADGYYKYYLKGSVSPNFEFFMTRHHGQHAGKSREGENTVVDQGTFDTSGHVVATFRYVARCDGIEAKFESPLGNYEQGGAGETNLPKASPNRFQSFPGFRKTNEWMDGATEAPPGWGDGLLIYELSVNVSWNAHNHTFVGSGSVGRDIPFLGESSLEFANKVTENY